MRQPQARLDNIARRAEQANLYIMADVARRIIDCLDNSQGTEQAILVHARLRQLEDYAHIAEAAGYNDAARAMGRMAGRAVVEARKDLQCTG